MPKVSIFKNVFEVENPRDMDLIYYLERTRDGEWEDIVTSCRRIKDHKEQMAFKQTMPTTTLSGSFRRRSDAEIVEHTGYISMDLDDIDDYLKTWKQMCADKYVVCAFMSTGGFGMRVLFKIDPAKHRESFLGISKYLFDHYSIVVDPNSSPSKPYVVSYDPSLYFNFGESIPTFKAYPKEVPIKKIPNFVHTAGDFDEVMRNIKGSRVSICEDYLNWLKVGFGLADQFGENGRQYFHEISEMSNKYKPKDVDKQYKYCLQQKGQGHAGIQSVYYLAKLNGVKIVTEQTKEIVKATRTGKVAGLKKEQIIENLKKFSNITNADTVVESVFNSVENDEDEDSIIDSLEMFVNHNYTLQMNEVTGFLEQNGIQLTQNDLNTMFIAAKRRMPKLDYQLLVRFLKSDAVPHYNPFFKFFDSDGFPVVLPPIPVKSEKVYDSPLIDKLAESIENSNAAYTLHFVRKWVVSIISAAHKVHSPLLLCLLGGQNTGKTEFFRRLLPSELQSYYAESKLDKEKDDELLMCENLIIMDDELSGKSKQDNLKLKNLTSKQWFSLRRPYGDHNEKILRLAVLCGTSNTLEIMSDTTGNRRIIPIEVDNINKELYNSIDKKELFLEAFRIYKEGFDWRVSQDDIAYLNKDQHKYEMISGERELLNKYFHPQEDSKVRLTTTEIKIEIEKVTLQKLNTVQLGKELEKLGFTRKTTRDGPYSTVKKWCVIRINRLHEDTTRNEPNVIIDESGEELPPAPF